MTRALVALALGLAMAAPAQAARFAISCSGQNIPELSGAPGKTPAPPTPIEDVVYVIDEEAQTVERFIPPPRAMLDKVCGIAGMECSFVFSADRVTVRGSKTDSDGSVDSVSFDWDRTTGHVESTLAFTSVRGISLGRRWSMQCKPVEMPDVGGAN